MASMQISRRRNALKERVKRIPILGSVARWLYRKVLGRGSDSGAFNGSAGYWEKRYATGGDSGVGSYARFAEFKADVLNGFVAQHHVQTVIELGCGDGNQLSLARYPAYLGLDVSPTAIAQCLKRFGQDQGKAFRLMSEYEGETADLGLSLDVVYHLVEDDVFEHYMQTLFEASERFVIIYSSNTDDNRGQEGVHVKHRQFKRWIDGNRPDWKLVKQLPNRYPYGGDYLKGSFAEFFVFKRCETKGAEHAQRFGGAAIEEGVGTRDS